MVNPPQVEVLPSKVPAAAARWVLTGSFPSHRVTMAPQLLPHTGFSHPSVQLLSHVQLFATPWTVARQASLSITNSQSLLKLISIESVMPSNHLILCRPLLPSIFPSIGLFQPPYWFPFSMSCFYKMRCKTGQLPSEANCKPRLLPLLLTDS